jgi:hypothetical protein
MILGKLFLDNIYKKKKGVFFFDFCVKKEEERESEN